MSGTGSPTAQTNGRFCPVGAWLSHPFVMMGWMKLAAWAWSNGVSRQTATRWFHAGVLPVPARQLATGTILVDEPAPGPGGVALYARVSSSGQRGDLERQLARLVEVATSAGLAPTKVVSEVGSGLNGSRCKLRALLGDPAVGVIVVEHRDRLARFGVEYVEALLAATGRRLVVVAEKAVHAAAASGGQAA